MNPEKVFHAMLGQTAIANIVGSRYSLGFLVQNAGFPAITYNTVSFVPAPNVAATGQQKAIARFQVDSFATSPTGVKSILEALRSSLDFKHQQTFAGKLVVSCRLAFMGQMERDDALGVWHQTSDFILHYYE